MTWTKGKQYLYGGMYSAGTGNKRVFADAFNADLMGKQGNQVMDGCLPTVGAQTNLTLAGNHLNVASGRVNINGYLNLPFVGGNIDLSSAHSALTTGESRYVIVTIYDNSGVPTLRATSGSIYTDGNQEPPEYPENEVAICIVYLTNSDTTMDANNFADWRDSTQNGVYGGFETTSVIALGARDIAILKAGEIASGTIILTSYDATAGEWQESTFDFVWNPNDSTNDALWYNFRDADPSAVNLHSIEFYYHTSARSSNDAIIQSVNGEGTNSVLRKIQIINGQNLRVFDHGSPSSTTGYTQTSLNAGNVLWGDLSNNVLSYDQNAGIIVVDTTSGLKFINQGAGFDPVLSSNSSGQIITITNGLSVATIYSNTIYEQGAGGVTIDSVLLKDNTVTATDFVFTGNLTNANYATNLSSTMTNLINNTVDVLQGVTVNAIEGWNGSAWVDISGSRTAENLFTDDETESVSLDSTYSKFRTVIFADSWTGCMGLFIGRLYEATNLSAGFTITIESDNASGMSSPTTVFSETFYDVNDQNVFIPINLHYSDRYWRITIAHGNNETISSGSHIFAKIKGLPRLVGGGSSYTHNWYLDYSSGYRLNSDYDVNVSGNITTSATSLPVFVATDNAIHNAYIRQTHASADNVGLYLQTGAQGNTDADGIRWGLNSANAFLWLYENLKLAFATNNTERGYFEAGGNFVLKNALKVDTINEYNTGSGVAVGNALKCGTDVIIGTTGSTSYPAIMTVTATVLDFGQSDKTGGVFMNDEDGQQTTIGGTTSLNAFLSMAAKNVYYGTTGTHSTYASSGIRGLAELENDYGLFFEKATEFHNLGFEIENLKAQIIEMQLRERKLEKMIMEIRQR